jgi:hypothetical protein
VIGVGVAFSAAGVYFMLGAAGYAPMPEGNSPAFIGFFAGLAFLFAGLTCMVRARAGMTDKQDDVPEDAPRWTKAAYRILGIGCAGALATIGTWIAIGSGPRAFSLSAPFAEVQTTGEAIGRTVFGLGAVIVWIYVIALTVSTVRKFFGPPPSPSIVPSDPAESGSRPEAPAEKERVTTPE